MSVAQLFELLGGRNAVAEAAGVMRNTVDWWVKRQAIPARKWPVIIRMAERAEIQGITLEALSGSQPIADRAAA